MRPSVPLIVAVLAWWVLAGTARAGDIDSHLAQARLFAKKGWYDDAAVELQGALESPEGQDSWEVTWLAAQVAWEVLDMEWALAMARQARRVAPDPDKRNQASALVESYEQGFGFLQVKAPYPGMATRMQLEVTGLVLDPELKRYINRCALKWRERTALPARIGLPVGIYLVNGLEVTLEPSHETSIVLPMGAIGARGLAALQVTRAEISGGIGFFLGSRVNGLLPAPHVQAGITQPLGPVLLGASAELSSQGYLGPDNQVAPGSPAWSVGLRLGTELVTRLPLAIRPSLTARFIQLPGIPMDCAANGETWLCVAPDGVEIPDMRLYATGRAWAPGAELSIEYREAGRTTALGTGFKLGVDQAFGTIPDDARAAVYGDLNADVVWQAQDDRWSATGVRMLANISFAF